jgi:regulator of protease activity HflC (stomatin/prohibitin superfamily)
MNAETELPLGLREALDREFHWGRWVFIILGSLLLVFAAFWIRPALGYLTLFLAPFLIVVTGPPKVQRILGLACSVWFVALGCTVILGLLTNLDIMTSMAIGLVLGIVIVGALFWALILISSQFVLALYPGVRPGDAGRQLWTLITGINYPYQIVENGKVARTKPAGILDVIGGPGIVVIKPGNAVVFELGGTVTKIEGPGVVKTRMFETIKQVVDLRPQWETIEANDVQTRDGIPLHLKAGVSYQIEPLANTVERLAAGGPVGPFDATIMGVHPVHKNNVFCAVYLAGTSDWQRASRGAAELALRHAIGRLTLSEIYGQATDDAVAPTIIPQLNEEASKEASTWAIDWGVTIALVDIISLEAPAEVRDRILKQWEAAAQHGLITAKGEAEARVLKALEYVKADARERLLARIEDAIEGVTILQPDQFECYLELLERLTTQATKDSATALRYIEALEQLSQNPNARVVIVPPGQALTITE